MGVIEKQSIQDIADAIRDRNGLTTLYKPRQMDEAIRGLYKTEAVNHIFDNLTISTTAQGSSITITDANTTQQAEITEIRGKGEKRKLPSEYQEVEYIEATGTQWINTLYSMLEQNVWKLETKVNLTANSLGIMGYALETDNSNEVWTDGQGYIIARFLPEVNRVVIKQLSLNTDYTITFDNNSNNFIVSINEETFTYNRIEPRQRTNAPIGFGHRQGGAYLKGKIYSLKMWSDTLERNFIPCYRVVDNVVGMYDTVTNTFYENAGTDAFGKGADIIYNNVTGDNNIVVSNNNLESSYRVDLGGKNTFNVEQAITRMENSGGTLINGWGTYEDGIVTMNRSMGYHGTCYFAGQKFNLKANKTYTLSATVYLTGTNATSNVILGFEGASNPNVTITKEVWTKVSKTVTFTEDKENVRVFIQPSNTGNVLQMKEIMLCEGTDTEYSPYNPIELTEQDKLWNNNGTWQLNDTAITDNYLLTQLQALENIELYEDLCYVDFVGNVKADMSLLYYVDGEKILEEIRKE